MTRLSLSVAVLWLVQPPPAVAQNAKPPPASVVKAAETGAPISKSQAKRNRKKLREANH